MNLVTFFRNILVLTLFVLVGAHSILAQSDLTGSSPFEKHLQPLFNDSVQQEVLPVQDLQENIPVKTLQKPAFRLVVTQNRLPEKVTDKSIYGIITLCIHPDYKATSQVVYALPPYRFDRLSWAIRTGWNDTIPYFSRLREFKPYLEDFNELVYAHFYILGVKEYPEYPGQYYHFPREALEDYYLSILQQIDTVAIPK